MVTHRQIARVARGIMMMKYRKICVRYGSLSQPFLSLLQGVSRQSGFRFQQLAWTRLLYRVIVGNNSRKVLVSTSELQTRAKMAISSYQAIMMFSGKSFAIWTASSLETSSFYLRAKGNISMLLRARRWLPQQQWKLWLPRRIPE